MYTFNFPLKSLQRVVEVIQSKRLVQRTYKSHCSYVRDGADIMTCNIIVVQYNHAVAEFNKVKYWWMKKQLFLPFHE